MTISEKLKSFIEQRNIDQKDIAKIANVTEGAVSQWLSGATVPKIGRLQKIAQHFGAPLSSLVDEQSNHIVFYNGSDEIKQEIAELTTKILETTDNPETLTMLKNMLSGICGK